MKKFYCFIWGISFKVELSQDSTKLFLRPIEDRAFWFKEFDRIASIENWEIFPSFQRIDRISSCGEEVEAFSEIQSPIPIAYSMGIILSFIAKSDLHHNFYGVIK